DKRSDSFRVGEIASGGHVLSGSRCFGGIDGVDVVILVAGFVLDVEDVLAVTRPEVNGDRALGIGGYRFCIRKRLGRLLHPDVAGALERFDKGDERAVRRNLGARDLGVAKKELAINQGWTLRPYWRREYD